VQELDGEARLAHPRGAGDEHDARALLLDALVEARGHRAQLPVAPDVRRGPAEQRPRTLHQRALAAEQEPGLALDHVEPRVEQAGHHVVEDDRRRLAGRARCRRREPRRALEDGGVGELAARVGAAHRDAEGPARRERLDRQRCAGGAGRLIGRHLAVRLDHDDRRAVGAPIDAAAVRPEHAPQRLVGERRRAGVRGLAEDDHGVEPPLTAHDRRRLHDAPPRQRRSAAVAELPTRRR
jgi:hypothetical protein